MSIDLSENRCEPCYRGSRYMYQADCSSSLVCHALKLLPRHACLRGGGTVGEAEGEQGGFSRKWGSLNSRFGVIGVERGQWASRNCVQNISSINIS